MDSSFPKRFVLIIIALIISLASLVVFLLDTGIIRIPLVMVLISLFILFPYRQETGFIRRLILLISILLIGWLLSDLGYAILPFIISFLIAYICDPIVSYLNKKGIPRWLGSLLLILGMLGAILLLAIFLFPILFLQLDAAIAKISTLVKTAAEYVDTNRLYRLLRKFGISKTLAKSIVNEELIPKLQGIFTKILEALMSLLTGLSKVATQIINVILIPILSFYFLKDFQKLKNLIRSALSRRHYKLFKDLRRIDRIWRIYISWQILAAVIVATVCSTFFSIFGVPYPVVIGIICGFLNPIPFIGIFASLLIGVLITLIVNTGDVVSQIIAISIIIRTMHFINAYFLEPNIAGKQVGLHPVVLIASLFVFGGMFGFIGLLIAVPTTATLVMFFNDWRANQLKETQQFNEFKEQGESA
ncbi:MAG: family transporter [Bacteroidota bacterium]|nr:family transporter [Bacteroidota bacterium]